MKSRKFVSIVTALIFTSCSQLPKKGGDREPTSEVSSNSWVGPMTFQDGSKVQIEPPFEFVRGALIRKDYHDLFSKPDQWQKVLKRTKVFKLYIGVFYPPVSPQYPDFGSTDEQLIKMAKFFNENQIEVAIEIGGLRPPYPNCKDLVSGTFNQEKVHLDRWVSLGGRIDYLIFDHPIGYSLMSQTWDRKSGQAKKVTDSCQNSFQQIVFEAVRSMNVYKEHLRNHSPNLKIGLIESLGYYTFFSRSPSGQVFKYGTTAPDKYPEFLFSNLFVQLAAASKPFNFAIDHFGLDFNDAFFNDASTYKAKSAYIQRGGGLPDRDYGRLFSAIEDLEKDHIKIAYIVNAFGKTPQEVELYSKTFRNEIKRIHGPFDFEVYQFWHNIPAQTLPEGEPGTALNIFQNIMNSQ